MLTWKIGQWEFIRNNGAFSLLYHGSDREYIVNVKPTIGQSQELLIQLFVMQTPKDKADAQ